MKTPVWFKPAPPGDYDPALANYEMHEDGSDWPALAWKVRDLATATEIAKRINSHDLLIAALKSIEEWTHIDPAKSSAPEDCYTDALVEIGKIAERVVRVPEAMGYLLPEKT